MDSFKFYYCEKSENSQKCRVNQDPDDIKWLAGSERNERVDTAVKLIVVKEHMFYSILFTLLIR